MSIRAIFIFNRMVNKTDSRPHQDMNDSLAQIIKIQRPDQAILHFARVVADTGEHPILAVTTDQREFWCKRFDYDARGITVINEIVATEIGKIIGAPVRDWAVVSVPTELQGIRVMDSNVVYPRLPMFGSKHIPNSASKDDLIWVDRDGNYSRMPHLIALWHLCNADDTQIIYDLGEDAQVYSIDHGYWFDSWEGSRYFGEGMTLYQRLPELRGKIPLQFWEDAKESLNKLDVQAAKHIPSLIPIEWEVEESEIMDMIEYSISRIPYTIEQLEKYKQRKLA